MTRITKTAALRVALAAKALEGITPQELAVKLAERYGLPLTEETLAAVTVAEIKTLLSGEESVEPDQPMASLKLAVRYLWGENGDEVDLPRAEPYREGEIPGSLRVACASNTGENLDGHFGSAPRFLIYQVGRNSAKLIDIRPTLLADASEDRNAARAELIGDCQIVYVQSIGGPATAKVVRAGLHPVKIATPLPAPEAIARLQAVLDAPPPWLAKILGVEARSLAPFREAAEA